ncbi:unnamed protein product [Boreogadus saida]
MADEVQIRTEGTEGAEPDCEERVTETEMREEGDASESGSESGEKGGRSEGERGGEDARRTWRGRFGGRRGLNASFRRGSGDKGDEARMDGRTGQERKLRGDERWGLHYQVAVGPNKKSASITMEHLGQTS